MLYSLSPKQKGFALIAIPLVVQILFVSILAWCLTGEAQAARNEMRSRDAILSAQVISKSVTEMLTDAITYQTSNGLVGEPVPQERFESLHAELRRLETLIVGEREQTESIKQMRALLEKLEPVIRKPVDASGAPLFKTSLTDERFPNDLEAFFQNVDSVVKVEERLNKNAPVARAHLKDLVFTTLTIAILVNGVLVIALPVLFSRSITGRLATIAAKTDRLAERKPLGERLPGRDEIAALDEFLHRADREIEKALSNEKSTIEHAADGIFMTDSQGKVTGANAAASRLTGRPGELLIGADIVGLVEEESTEIVDTKLREAVAGLALQPFEASLAGDAAIEALWSVYWSELDSALFIVVHDLCEVKKVERMKQEFVATISHDLRTPLTAIENALSMVEMGVAGPVGEEALAELQGARRNAHRLIKLVNDLLDVEKLRAGRLGLHREPVVLSSIVGETIEMVSGAAAEQRVSVAQEDTEYTVLVDRDRIAQVLANLLSNAIKFSPPGEVVRVSARPIDRYLQVLVSDRGPGIPDEFTEKIFSVYEQVDARRETEKKGTGLGLAICAGIVAEHGGDIGVLSQVGFGSAFWFTVPLQAQDNT
ncbi:MAG: ATP-binding protein [Candidatus Obscuribacterales bacterium]